MADDPEELCGCGKVATRYCDFMLIGTEAEGYPKTTCDKPICEDCAVELNPLHICGTHGCFQDTHDLCPSHAAYWRATGDDFARKGGVVGGPRRGKSA